MVVVGVGVDDDEELFGALPPKVDLGAQACPYQKDLISLASI